MADFVFKPVTKTEWPDFLKLFQAKGGPSYCWCLPFRHLENRQHASPIEKKATFSKLVDMGMQVGILAYHGDEVAGWCSVAPRETFRKLSPEQVDQEPGIWAITCFFVPRVRRGRGLGRALLDAAVDHAFRQGARAIEAYPVDPESPSYRFMGFRDMFAARGFRKTGMAGSRRHIMRLEPPA
jgi:GNAT superfamily N-acetyltransferase